jgi:DNA-binding NtrC family response regulator
MSVALLDPACHEELVGSSARFTLLKNRLPAVAQAQRTTLISGPTGSGKDVVARSLHAQSPRKSRPFVAVHCAALPDTLVEAEMFGHSRGAFTGATHLRQGLIRSAASGTIFLDEIDSLPSGAQAKLLRFLETGEYRAVGSDQTERSDAWVLAATNQDLGERVSRGMFRADLMYRLAVVNLQVPALVERADDMLTLAEHFLAQTTGGAKRFDDGARAALRSYAWPGNVRELKHRVETAALFDENDVIGRQALDLPAPPALPRPPSRDGGELATTDGTLAAARGELEHDLWSLIAYEGMTLSQAMGRCEQLMIRAALRAEGNNRTRAAGRLGIHVRTIFKKLP